MKDPSTRGSIARLASQDWNVYLTIREANRAAREAWPGQRPEGQRPEPGGLSIPRPGSWNTPAATHTGSASQIPVSWT